ncbi:MAG: C40 family peptidase [Candidatus Riflebacteria bacterium]|nr:C40 family peptidase [Candidatus Riflebacteria bacterium]
MDAGIMIADLIGKPFSDGGRGPDTFDCWGLCMTVFKRFGYRLPEYPVGAYEPEQINSVIMSDRKIWQELEKPQKPCLVLMRLGVIDLINHCGVYTGDGFVLHTRKKTGSILERINSPFLKIMGYVLPPEEFRL